MAAVFPLDTAKPWTFNGVTYEYDAAEDRWFVISTNKTDLVDDTLETLTRELDVTNTVIDQEIENRNSLLDVAASKNNQQDGAIAELDQRLDAVSDAVGAIAFVAEYTYVLERKDTTCFNAYAACLIDAGGDLASQSACQNAFDECNREIGDPYPLGSFTSQDTNILDFIENFIITTPDLNGQELDWENLLEVGDYLELYDEKDFDTALYQVVSPPSAFGNNPGEKIVRVNFLKQTSIGDGKLNFQEDYTIRLIKASQGLDLSEADKRYVIKPYVVYFADTPADITPVHESGNLRNGELWFDTSSLELFVWNNNSWVGTAPPPSQDIVVSAALADIEELKAKPDITSSATAPVNPKQGDLWFNPSTLKFAFYTSGAWINPDQS